MEQEEIVCQVYCYGLELFPFMIPHYHLLQYNFTDFCNDIKQRLIQQLNLQISDSLAIQITLVNKPDIILNHMQLIYDSIIDNSLLLNVNFIAPSIEKLKNSIINYQFSYYYISSNNNKTDFIFEKCDQLIINFLYENYKISNKFNTNYLNKYKFDFKNMTVLISDNNLANNLNNIQAILERKIISFDHKLNINNVNNINNYNECGM